MSTPVLDVDERFWEMYLMDCKGQGLTPSIKDFIIWLQEEGYDFDFVDYPEQEYPDVE